MQKTNEKVKGLAQAVEKIGEVVELINDIASQTASGTQNVTTNIVTVAEQAKEAGNEAGNVQKSAGELTTNSEELANAVQSFLKNIRSDDTSESEKAA